MWPTRAKFSGTFETETMVRPFGSEGAEMITVKEKLTGTFDAGDLRDVETG